MSPRMRSSSDSGSSGFMAMSATMRTNAAACSDSTSPPTVDWSRPMPTPTWPPIAATVSAMSCAERDVVPSFMS